jgi:hypothetical protein
MKGIRQNITAFFKQMTGFYEYTKGIRQNMTAFLKYMTGFYESIKGIYLTMTGSPNIGRRTYDLKLSKKLCER